MWGKAKVIKVLFFISLLRVFHSVYTFASYLLTACFFEEKLKIAEDVRVRACVHDEQEKI